MGRILGLVNGVWATAQERKMHAIRQRFNLYAGGSLSADISRFFQLISADEVLGTHIRVGTTHRSISAIASAWLRRNVRQPCYGGPRRPIMYFQTVDFSTSNP